MNWIAILVIVCAFLLILWLTSMLAKMLRAGRSGMGWVFLAVLVSGIVGGVVLEFSGISPQGWVGLLISIAIAVLVFAVVLDAGVIGGLVVSLGYSMLVAGVLAAAFFIFGLQSIESLGKIFRLDTVKTDEMILDGAMNPPGEDAVEESGEGQTPELLPQTGQPAQTQADFDDPDKIIGFTVNGPLKEYSFDDEPAQEAVTEPVSPAYRETSFSDMKQYINHRVRILRKDGVTVEGGLLSVGSDSLELKRRASTGYAILPVPGAAIRTIEVYR